MLIPLYLHYSQKYENMDMRSFLAKKRVIHIISCSILELRIIMYLCLQTAHILVYPVFASCIYFHFDSRLRFRRKNLK